MKYLNIFIFIMLCSCNLNDLIELHGISNLRSKINQIKIKESNENDIIAIFGPPLVRDPIDKKFWSYFEVKTKKNLFGSKKIILNNIVILEFDNLGILKDFSSYDINSLKNLQFSEDTTETRSVKMSTIQSILSSTKKRMEMVQKRLKTNEQ